MIKLFNSLTNQQEELMITNKKISLYVCGPTVYNYMHIGNSRPIITFDILRRLLEFLGNKVDHISNYTDIDDKIIAQAIQEKTTEKIVAQKYIQAYEQDLKSLNVLKPVFQPKVTDVIIDIISFIKNLTTKGFTYKISNGDLYFRISKIKEYNQLSNNNLSSLIVNASSRIDEKEKENPLDFVLWKKTTTGIKFASPWGEGRPGWHSECVVMINNYSQNKIIDIHGGGLDLKFPHHTNEIAQSLAYNNHKLSRFWLYNGFVNMENEKMSKSLGNIILVKDILQKWNINIYKLVFLATHYQKPLKYNEIELKQQKKVWLKIGNVIKLGKKYFSNINNAENGKYLNQVIKQLSTNLNTANALTSLLLAIKEFNKLYRDSELAKAKLILNEIKTIIELLGLEFK